MDDSVLLSKKQERATSPTGTQERATACLLTTSQKSQIRRSQCTRSNVARDASNQFIANATKWPFVQVNPPNPAFVHKFVHFVYKRSIDLGINRIIGGRPINPHQFKFVVSTLRTFILFSRFLHIFLSNSLYVTSNLYYDLGCTSNRRLSRSSETILWRFCYR